MKTKTAGLSKSQIAELYNIGNNMPVFAGKVLSKEDSQELIDMGLAMKYEGQYVLTEKGKEELKRRKIEGCKMIIENSDFLNDSGKFYRGIDHDFVQEDGDKLTKL